MSIWQAAVRRTSRGKQMGGEIDQFAALAKINPREDIMTSGMTFNLEIKKVAATKLIARYAPAGARGILGLLFFVFGLNGFLNFLPQPTTPLPAGATAFFGALMNTGYMLPLIFATQLIVGTLLLANRFVPLAITLLAPFMVNSIAFHLFLERSGLPMAVAIVALQLYLAWTYREAFRPLLSVRG